MLILEHDMWETLEARVLRTMKFGGSPVLNVKNSFAKILVLLYNYSTYAV